MAVWLALIDILIWNLIDILVDILIPKLVPVLNAILIDKADFSLESFRTSYIGKHVSFEAVYLGRL